MLPDHLCGAGSPHILTSIPAPDATLDLARATIRRLEQHDVVFWEKHGILATGADIVDCFDVIDTLNKSAQIYLCAHQAGFEPEGMTRKQLDDLVPVFNIPKGHLDI